MTKTLKRSVIAMMLSASVAALAIAEEQKAPAQDSPRASKPHWAWQPVYQPFAPDVQKKDWARASFDAFVLAKIEARKLTPSPEADRATFIRRATLDAWGLIPTPEEVAAFESDASPDAYETLVDRLLASPRYGERQARLWLDLARYADSAGFQNDNNRLNMFRYRDYVIGAFNADKPYSQFIREQIAADEIAPGDQEALVATGFLAGYPDNSNSRDLVQRKYQITTDIVDTVGQAILGTTVGCARCHNHKTDKFTQKDYYSLQAFFANTAFDERLPAKKGEVEAEFQKEQAVYNEATRAIRARQKEIIDSVREAALKYHKERYLTDSRESIFKPKDQWTALDRWVNHRLDSVTNDAALAGFLRYAADDKSAPEHSKEIVEKADEYQKLTQELRKFQNVRSNKGSLNYTAATELGHSDAPPTYIFFGGNHEKPLEEVQPAFPDAMTSETPDIKPTATSSGRRTALADWLVSEKNPLTARVFVNRVWNQYFGKGIVGTVSDFGKAGDKPTNQELLDHLAFTFVKDGWSVKRLHRSILLSATYRQSSDYREDVAKADPENKLLAVFPRKRLEAEEIRDSILLASGHLNERVGGPSVFPPIPANLVGSGNFNNTDPSWTTSKDPQDHVRRSLYIFTRRSLPYPLLETFDMANPQQIHSKRDVTTTPLQALTLYNSDLVFQWSQALAGRVIEEAGDNERAQIERLYLVLFGRKPSEAETKALNAFLDQHQKTIAAKAENGKLSLAVPVTTKARFVDPLRASAFVDLVHTVVNSNDFVYRF
ncbi:DUF1553 domain-containing protein [Methylosinus sporium]|uniref:DUF1553 domain-containing protein n=1 Tax=Methylosinus sporium TaxID=428 RepID=A0A549SXT7_METSR|nr:MULTISPECIES: DUF1549 and DUF1553 domain-containing protein [Methylosinus]MBU3889349.1 DUF1549 and DUF1553 domain-containing protein [Methylosinus sp. KRF6]TRL34443.1 DUF1553 domain-containing protein [Methylosinus sporium]